jgi:hypothetical protein
MLVFYNIVVYFALNLKQFIMRNRTVRMPDPPPDDPIPPIPPKKR